MNELLQELTPPEIAIWLYLSELELAQGGKIITIPRSGPGKLYTRQHLKRILKALEAKKYLVITASPTNQHENLRIALGSRPRLNISVQATRQEYSGRPLHEVFVDVGRTEKFRQPGQEDSDRPGLCAARSREDVQAAPQLSLSSRQKDLKAFVEMGQEQLMSEVLNLGDEDLSNLRKSLWQLAPWPKGKFSERAKLYAGVRFLQDGKSQAKSDVAWVTGVAKRAHYQMAQVGRGAVSGPRGNPAFVPAGLRQGAGR